MAVTAKVRLSRVTRWDGKESGDPYEDGAAAELEFTPDYGQGKNEEWAAATPSAVFRMTVGNPNALKQFEQGKSYTVTFEAEAE